MRVFKILSILIVVIGVACLRVYADKTRIDPLDAAVIEQWGKRLESKGVKELAEALASKDSPWPKLISITDMEKLSGMETYQVYWDLSHSILNVVETEFKEVDSGDFDSVEAFCKDLFNVERNLRQSGGYTNIVIADAVAEVEVPPK